ncbi:hypothetical protein EJ110_NYTH33850 [Nymphaea thermarum]|nr:hypothetical protein EJ110_NYTH33850 [Nymphaea thermarum]
MATAVISPAATLPSSSSSSSRRTRANSGLNSAPSYPTFHEKEGRSRSSFYGRGLSINGDGQMGVVLLRKEGKGLGRRKSGGGLEVRARTAGASKNIEVEVDKPLGLTLGQKPGGGVVITVRLDRLQLNRAVDGGGNAAKAGLKAGDQVLYTSSFFGDELWPADKLGFTKTAIQAKPDSVYFVISRGAEVDVKRLPKRPAPPRFGRKLTEAQKPENYICPQCSAPKKRFARYDVNTGRAIGGGLPPIGVIVGLVAGIAGVGALLVYGLQ